MGLWGPPRVPGRSCVTATILLDSNISVWPHFFGIIYVILPDVRFSRLQSPQRHKDTKNTKNFKAFSFLRAFVASGLRGF